MPRKKKDQSVDPTLQSNDTTSRRALIGVLAAAVITAIAGIVVAFINGWFTNEKPKLTSDGTIYRVRVTVLDAQGTPTEDAKVWSSFGGEPKKVAGGWQFDINNAAKPIDGKLTVYALNKDEFLKGNSSLVLSADNNPAVTIKLKRDDSAKVRGQVKDGNGRAVAGVRVFVSGYGSEAVITDVGGNFVLPGHAAQNQRVRIYAEKRGFRPTDEWHYAGEDTAIIVLYR